MERGARGIFCLRVVWSREFSFAAGPKTGGQVKAPSSSTERICVSPDQVSGVPTCYVVMASPQRCATNRGE